MQVASSRWPVYGHKGLDALMSKATALNNNYEEKTHGAEEELATGYLNFIAFSRYRKNRYVAFTKKMLLEPPEKALSKRELNTGVSNSATASAVLLCDHTR